MKSNLNVEIGGCVITDVAEKIGALFGTEGREIGKAIDSATKNITIKIGASDSTIASDKDADKI